MQIRKFPVMLVVFVSLPLVRSNGQAADSLERVCIEAITVNSTFAEREKNASALSVGIADRLFLRENFTGNLMQTLEYIPGVRSMDIGSGFSKPVIRGMGFNRIAVLENGIKQEGQQWGADHGLEIDAFNVERVVIRKGPSSLMYGSDAMGGTVEILPLPPPAENLLYGETVFFVRSVNGNLAGSVMVGMKRNRWHTRIRYSEQRFGDYRVPADTVVYLTQKLPLYGKKLKNTAGQERDASWLTEYRAGGYYANFYLSDSYQKAGFFPGAHGIPDAARLEPGGSRNVELPYSTVNHFKANSRHQYSWKTWIASLDIGFQNNRRTEMSSFHTHYGDQPRPEKDPDKELFFSLNTFSLSGKVRYYGTYGLEHTAGIDLQVQDNRTGGYAFLLPEYTRLTSGLFWITGWHLSDKITLTGGMRYDSSRIKVSEYKDDYLADYLLGNGYPQETVDQNQWRSYGVDKTFGDFSGAAGIVWNPAGAHRLKANLGRSFRLPGANELASNGVHHGTFRHEQGDPGLGSERGWQLDAEYSFVNSRISVAVSPFASRYNNYIYLQPTGEWSILPHSGQVYRYTGAKATLAGGEVEADVRIAYGLVYTLSGEYVYTRNRNENIPLAFSPPATMRNVILWAWKSYGVHFEMETIARQRRVARNESPTAGANLFHAGVSLDIRLGTTALELNLTCRNIADRKYYNHLSFYRQMEIPEPGRNFQLLIKVPFNIKIK